jgi:multisubunit Na+/H+ antiporter MnhC subunit
MADAFVYQTAWRATVLTAVVVIVGLLAFVAVTAMRRRRARAHRSTKPVSVPSPMVRSK